MTGASRKSVEELIKGIDKQMPIIMMDHEPSSIAETVAAKVDLSLSGHTHHGQMWPFNYATQGIFEVSRGYHIKGNTHYYVSTGFGTWGPRVRIGNRPEIVVIDIKR